MNIDKYSELLSGALHCKLILLPPTGLSWILRLVVWWYFKAEKHLLPLVLRLRSNINLCFNKLSSKDIGWLISRSYTQAADGSGDCHVVPQLTLTDGFPAAATVWRSARMPFSELYFNVDNGYLEGLVRGFKAGILSQADYLNLVQCETLEGELKQTEANC